MTQETRAFDADVGKILHLMIHSLYEHKEIFLRELISNASDACDKLRYEALTEAGLLPEGEALKITISVDKKKSTLTIADNGIGMSKEELKRNLGTIARSGTQNFIEKLSGDKKKDAQLIGQFGVGFYSSFMVADKVEVSSRRAGKKAVNHWESDGKGEYAITDSKEKRGQGTAVTLHLREDEAEFLDVWRLKHIISTYSDHISFPIELVDEDGKAETVNQGSALWTRKKSDITEEQYKEFYRHTAHLHDTPWLTLHNQVEGALSYTNLLFIPSQPPFDLFHPERMTRVKLYVKRVFITEKHADVLPRYLRFVQGVVDSQDLPLNISRETFQHNAIMEKMRRAITKRILSELKKKAESDPKAYTEFWGKFGAVIKEGLCDAMEPREEILEVCRFRSTQSGDGLISLADYIARMQPNQKGIYYIVGDNVAGLAHSPQLEGFKAKNIEVLLLSDPVDDFWLTVTHEFKGQELLSVTRAGNEAEEGEKPQEAEKEAEKADDSEEMQALLAFFKATLGEAVKEVRISKKLTESPVCLSVPEGAMDMRMERFLVDNKQLPGRMAKILEINAKHPIIRALAKDVALQKDAGSNAGLEDAVHLLFGQANIIEGEPVADITGFTRRFNFMLEKLLAA